MSRNGTECADTYDSHSHSDSESESGSIRNKTLDTRALGPVPESVASFFNNVTLGGFPEPEQKVQPWKRVWKGPQEPATDGKLLVACPKICVYGKQRFLLLWSQLARTRWHID
jgi:hypothetical protein